MRKLLALLVVITANLTGFTVGAQAQPPASYGVEIYVFRVGQADSMLIVGPRPARRTLLVDLGVSRERPYIATTTADHVARRIFEITGRRHLDYFLLTHFHSDHLGGAGTGMAVLLDSHRFTVGTVVDTGNLSVEYLAGVGARTSYDRRMTNWRRAGAVRGRVLPQFGTRQINLGRGVRVDILAFGGLFGVGQPSVHAAYSGTHLGHYRRNSASENDLSIAFELSLGNFEFWTGGDLSGADRDGTAPLSGSGGDAYTNVEFPMVRHWVATGRESDVEVYRANHHGSRYSSGTPFLAALDPEHVLYSADAGHGHPNEETVDRFLGHVWQWATGLDPRWGDGQRFLARRGRVADELRIFVSPNGSRYWINDVAFRSYSDTEERRNVDRLS
jgi:beta-lactamase superfamily II metal-dependent hydrolase